jgi:hypothetical protein
MLCTAQHEGEIGDPYCPECGLLCRGFEALAHQDPGAALDWLATMEHCYGLAQQCRELPPCQPELTALFDGLLHRGLASTGPMKDFIEAYCQYLQDGEHLLSEEQKQDRAHDRVVALFGG